MCRLRKRAATMHDEQLRVPHTTLSQPLDASIKLCVCVHVELVCVCNVGGHTLAPFGSCLVCARACE